MVHCDGPRGPRRGGRPEGRQSLPFRATDTPVGHASAASASSRHADLAPTSWRLTMDEPRPPPPSSAPTATGGDSQPPAKLHILTGAGNQGERLSPLPTLRRMNTRSPCPGRRATWTPRTGPAAGPRSGQTMDDAARDAMAHVMKLRQLAKENAASGTNPLAVQSEVDQCWRCHGSHNPWVAGSSPTRHGSTCLTGWIVAVCNVAVSFLVQPEGATWSSEL
jgi:hypothetical protein